MFQRPARGLFIAGTNTDAGKTYVSALIAKQLHRQGHRVGVYKPVASGCVVENSELVSDDAVQLWQAAGKPLDLDAVCPQRFAAPITPHLSAIAEGKTLDREQMRAGLSAWVDHCDIVIVEGAGGLMTPLNEDEFFADLALEFGYPVIVVTPNIIGAINQTLQTLIAAACFRDGLNVAGVVLNDVVDGTANDDPSVSSNRQQIADRTPVPMLAHVAHGADAFDEEVDWFAMADSNS